MHTTTPFVQKVLEGVVGSESNPQFKEHVSHKVKDRTNKVQVATHSLNGHALWHYVLLGNANYF